MSTTKKAALTALLALIGYFAIPGIAMLTPGAHWDGNGPRYEETGLGNAFFWAMMASLAIFVIATCAALVSAIIGRVRRRAPQS